MSRSATKNTITRKQELPLDKGEFSFFMKLMTACAVFLFAITAAGVLSINSIIGKWNEGAINTFTVQVMPVVEDESASTTDEELQKVVDFLKKMPEIKEVSPLDDEMHEKLIRPWLGDGIDIKSLAMPRLIDVSLYAGSKPDYDELSAKLAEVSEYASLDSHKIWLLKLMKFAASLKTLAIIVLLLVITICGVSIFYATKTNLGLHKDIIEILHLMGAKDTYIAQQYAHKTAVLSLLSGALGIFAAILVINVISELSEDLEGGIIKEAGLTLFSWFEIILIPFLVSAMATFTAYHAVKSTLRKMM